MAAAERVVAPGGTIVMAAECADGLPGGGAFERLLAGSDDAADAARGRCARSPAAPVSATSDSGQRA